MLLLDFETGVCTVVHGFVPSFIGSTPTIMGAASFSRSKPSNLQAKRSDTDQPDNSLFRLDDDVNDPADDNNNDDDDYFAEEGDGSQRSTFYDIDFTDDVDPSYMDDGIFAGYERDEVGILEEREDRLYVDEFGIKRKIETCILVGVENLSQKRKHELKDLRSSSKGSDYIQQQQQSLLENYDFYAPEFDSAVLRDNNKEDLDVYFTLEESLTEMRELVKTAGMEIVGEVTQRLNEINPKTYIGSGKVKEADKLLMETDCTTVVFDAELTPGQQKHLENIFNKNLIQNDFLVQDREIKVRTTT